MNVNISVQSRFFINILAADLFIETVGKTIMGTYFHENVFDMCEVDKGTILNIKHFQTPYEDDRFVKGE